MDDGIYPGGLPAPIWAAPVAAVGVVPIFTDYPAPKVLLEGAAAGVVVAPATSLLTSPGITLALGYIVYPKLAGG